MPGIAAEKPLGLDSGATEAAFDAEMLVQAMSGPAKEYRCAGNFFWLDFRYSPVRNVPIALGALQDLQQQVFVRGNVQVFPFEVVVALAQAPATGADASDLCKSGGLLRVSPCLSRARVAGQGGILACQLSLLQ